MTLRLGVTAWDSECDSLRRLYVVVCDSECKCLTVSHTCSWSPHPNSRWLWGLCQTDCVCGCVRLCVTAYTHLSGPKGTLGTLPGMAGRPGGCRGAGRAGSEVKRAESPSSPRLAPPGRQANGKNVHTRGRRVAAPPGTALCTENKFFWYQLKFGRKWLLGGRKLDSAHISSGRGAGEQLSRVKQSYQEAGPQHPVPDRAEGTAHPSWLFGMTGGRGKAL